MLLPRQTSRDAQQVVACTVLRNIAIHPVGGQRCYRYASFPPGSYYPSYHTPSWLPKLAKPTGQAHGVCSQPCMLCCRLPSNYVANSTTTAIAMYVRPGVYSGSQSNRHTYEQTAYWVASTEGFKSFLGCNFNIHRQPDSTVAAFKP